MESQLSYHILRQPDDTTCGPTCLHSVYAYFGLDVELDQLINEVGALPDGGTLAVFLGCDALERGFEAKIFTFNMQVFDPTWFREGAPPLADCLLAQKHRKNSAKLSMACDAYIEFLRLGGEIEMEVLTGNLIRRFLKKNVPLLTGLSSTFLYGDSRERFDVDPSGKKAFPDDIGGWPQGHFVVLCGYDSEEREVLIADPLAPNPLGADHVYPVDLDRVLNAILLGILTYDANVLVIRPARKGGKGNGEQHVNESADGSSIVGPGP
jgi:hypothetical protein